MATTSTSYADYDPKSLAQALITADRAGIDQMLSDKSTKFSTQVKGYTSLESYLSTFSDALDDYTKSSSTTSLSAQSATTSDTDYYTVTSDGTAASGNYYITVDKLAQSDQSALTFSNSDTALPSDGSLKFTINNKSMNIDFSKLNTGSTLSDLVTAINTNSDNPGVTASLIKSGDNTRLLLTSNETGAKYAIDMAYTAGTASTASTAFSNAVATKSQLSSAQDAVIELGATNKIQITSSSNTMENVIDGLTINLVKAQTSGSEPIRTSVAVDPSTVKTNLQGFVDKFNTLITNLTSLSSSSGDLSGNSTVRTITNQLKNAMRNSLPAGYTLDSLGLSFTSKGTLEVDSDTLTTALEKTPDILTKALTDDNALFDNIKTVLTPYTKTGGIISSLEDSAQSSLDRVTERQDKWNTQMENQYNIYLKQFIQMKTSLAQLSSSLSTLST